MIAVGPGSYLHDLIAIAGGVNVMASVTLEYPRISMETVISLAPDVIIDVGEMGETPADSERRRRSPNRSGRSSDWWPPLALVAFMPSMTRRSSCQARASSKSREPWPAGFTA